MKILFGTFAAVLFLHGSVSAQQLQQRVSMQFVQVPLEDVLAILSKEYELKFTYGDSKRALLEAVSIEAEDIPMDEFLRIVLQKAGLTYKLVGEYVVLRRIPEKKKEPVHLLKEESRSEEKEFTSGLPPETRTKRGAVELPELNKIGWKELESPPTTFPLLQLKPVETLAETANQGLRPFRMAPLVSLDLMRLSFSGYDSQQQLSSGVNYSLGWAAQWSYSERLGTEFQLLYRKKGFAILYILEMEDGPVGLPERTELDLTYFELPLGVSYQMFRYGNLALSGTAGPFASLLLEKEERTWLDDGRLFNTTAMYGKSLSPFLWGMRGSLRLAIRLNENFGFSLAPSYQYTANKLKKGVQQISLQEFTVRCGFVFRL